MSEYQYYEFCRINSPMPPQARKEMSLLSSRANIGTHNASYVYNYGDFRGVPKHLLLKYFDVFFYISNWGSVHLMFKYLAHQMNIDELKKYYIKNVISCELHDQNVVLDVFITNEEGGGWIEGEEWLPELLPLYQEVKNKDYQYLQLVSAINDEFTGEKQNTLDSMIARIELSEAQEALLNCIGIPQPHS